MHSNTAGYRFNSSKIQKWQFTTQVANVFIQYAAMHIHACKLELELIESGLGMNRDSQLEQKRHKCEKL